MSGLCPSEVKIRLRGRRPRDEPERRRANNQFLNMINPELVRKLSFPALAKVVSKPIEKQKIPLDLSTRFISFPPNIMYFSVDEINKILSKSVLPVGKEEIDTIFPENCTKAKRGDGTYFIRNSKDEITKEYIFDEKGYLISEVVYSVNFKMPKRKQEISKKLFSYTADGKIYFYYAKDKGETTTFIVKRSEGKNAEPISLSQINKLKDGKTETIEKKLIEIEPVTTSQVDSGISSIDY